MSTALDVAWPPLPLDAWRDTYDTLHMWTQIVGKTRLALAPMQNHWWQVPLYVTPRGLTTSAIPAADGRTFEVDFDFIVQELLIRASDGGTRTLALAPRTVADFYTEYTDALRALAIDVRIHPVPVEIVTAIPFADERDAIAIANDTPYGLTAYIWTNDSGRAFRMAHQVEAGMVWVNSENNRHLPTPFGGVKASGIGRDGGDYSFDFYMETKNICMAHGTHRVPKLGA